VYYLLDNNDCDVFLINIVDINCSPINDLFACKTAHSLNSIQGKRDEEDGISEDNEGSDSSESATITQIT